MLTGIPVVSPRIRLFPTVDPPQHPPVALYVLHLGDGLEAILVPPNTGSVLRVLLKAGLGQHAVDEVGELGVLVAVGHLAEVGAGRHLVLSVEMLQDAAIDTANCPHTAGTGQAAPQAGDTVAGQTGVGVPERSPGGGGHHLSPHEGGGDVEPLYQHHRHQHWQVGYPGARHSGGCCLKSLLYKYQNQTLIIDFSIERKIKEEVKCLTLN